jgi:hypothetical protein
LTNEFTGFTGSLTSGLIYLYYGVDTIMIMAFATTFILILLLRRI